MSSLKTKYICGEKIQKKRAFIWSTDRVLSISAFFISVISLIALLYQSYLARGRK